MKISKILKKYHNIEIELLLAHVLKKPKEFLYLNTAHELTLRRVKELTRMVKRRLAGEPMAYILGYKDFYGLRFKVNKDVLIPRPETEWLVERVLSKQYSVNSGKQIRILDVGTGSGCIAISIAKNIPKAQITAVDISEKALKTAKQNYHTHTSTDECAPIKFIKSDLFSKVKGKFDVIVANLPYVPLKLLHKFLHHKEKLKADDPFLALKFEPVFALTDGTSSFQIYRRFFEQVGGHLNPKSVILLEIDPSSTKFLTEYQKKYLPSWQIKFYKDFNGLWRYAEIKLSNK